MEEGVSNSVLAGILTWYFDHNPRKYNTGGLGDLGNGETENDWSNTTTITKKTDYGVTMIWRLKSYFISDDELSIIQFNDSR